MDAANSLLGYLSIYDFFARMTAGAVVLLMSSPLGIFDFIIGSTDASTVLAFIVLSYFAGIILEEISHILESIFHFRKKQEKTFCQKKMYRKYSFIKCKKALARNNNNDISDKSLSHIVMSSSISIGFSILILTRIGVLVYSLAVLRKDIMSTCLECIPVIAILIILIAILQFRKRNYTETRIQQIIDFCVANGYEDIYRNPKSKTRQADFSQKTYHRRDSYSSNKRKRRT